MSAVTGHSGDDATGNEYSGSWEQEGWLDDWWSPGEPDRRGHRPAKAVYDPGGDGTVNERRGKQHHHGS